jgi:hypothetical protein
MSLQMQQKRINLDFLIGTTVLYARGPECLGQLKRGTEYEIESIVAGFDEEYKETEFLVFKDKSRDYQYDHRMFDFYSPSFGQKISAYILIKSS